MTSGIKQTIMLSRYAVIAFFIYRTVCRNKIERMSVMDFTFLLNDIPITIYECSKRSGIPYSTLSDIIKGKTPIEKASVKNLHSLAETLDMSMDEVYSYMHVPERSDFENFKSETCHVVKELGDTGFIVDTLKSDRIRILYNWGWYPESLYLLAMLDYLSRENGYAQCCDYDDIRSTKLSETVYPASVVAMCLAMGNESAKEEAVRNALPEFLKYNIVESEIRNVI